jgi:hypothetical protein
MNIAIQVPVRLTASFAALILQAVSLFENENPHSGL